MNPGSFHEIIKYQRVALGITQGALADQLEVTGAYIAKLEKGGLDPSPRFIEKLAEILHCNLVDLYLAGILESKLTPRIAEILKKLRMEQHEINKNNVLRNFIDRLLALPDSRRDQWIAIFSEILNIDESKPLPLIENL